MTSDVNDECVERVTSSSYPACVCDILDMCLCVFLFRKENFGETIFFMGGEVLFTFPPFSPFLPLVFHGLQSTVQPHSMEEAKHKLYQPYLRNIYGYVAKYVLRYR